MKNTPRLARWVATYTFVWLLVYFPLETYVTCRSPAFAGFSTPRNIMNVVGMCLMLWGALSETRRQHVAPALLATGWSWTAATFWRATSDRFWFASLGHPLYAGPIELWLGPLLTILALAGLAGSLVVVVEPQRAADGSGRSAACS